MIYCGLKLTHDAAVAIIKDGNLEFCTEIEKLENNPRYAEINDTSMVARVLHKHGYTPQQVNFFGVDGWGGYDQEELALQPRLRIDANYNTLTCQNAGASYELKVAQYIERTQKSNILGALAFSGLKINDQSFNYDSFLHVTGHVLSAYCTSPFAQRNQASYVLIWDGGMFPYLYYVDPAQKSIENLGPIFQLIGNVYTIFSQHFGPFKANGSFAKDDLSVAGKVMAYIAYGKVREELFDHFDKIIETAYDHPMGFANVLAKEFRKSHNGTFSDEDVLMTFHTYLERMLVNKLRKKLSRFARKESNLCMAGGCALNIKWNSKIRESGLFNDVYVPPFPNDSGSAIGVACAMMVKHEKKFALRWNVYSGPEIDCNEPASGWSKTPCSLKELAAILHRNNEAVVFLNGRAELGPRALGNRSILASPQSPHMKDLLNKIKNRERYRPVSPVCLQEHADDFFHCGVPSDPYMLFDHQVKDGLAEKAPAICHLDGSARLQTVSKEQNPQLAELLNEYKRLTGIPFLCNTSANFKDKGFFPDVKSATIWGGTDKVWCNNTLYVKN